MSKDKSRDFSGEREGGEIRQRPVGNGERRQGDHQDSDTEKKNEETDNREMRRNAVPKSVKASRP